ncbi:hypothetical protein OC846_000709 [Tilletia horrida]|uniref:Conserved oligomeric Golgi complex subunit 2 n=1 Tax=Tilletia horrida TaxID=155126 RepID=A0AAN6GWH8_9BASI|nr:hypothetical protein OC845_002572 [Tilletia horrida]KAK0557062.1 hypothetical protein OC846_000709 [Tilletia horrida]KAK0568072.1 hypothetical protein OC861_002316 [Tilletia horrida]
MEEVGADSKRGHRRAEGEFQAGGSSFSSLDGIIAPFASLELAPLSLSDPHPLLLEQQASQTIGSGGASVADFDPDEFLCSRATGTKLNDIVAELETHHEEVQSHLLSLIQSHASEFRNLGDAVQQEAGTIDLLGVSHSRNSIDLRRRVSGGAVPVLNSTGAEQRAGLFHVRQIIEQTRDKLAAVRAEVDAVMEERKLCSQIQFQLALLLALHQSILRLETLLGLQGPGQITGGSGGPGASNGEDREPDKFDFRSIIGDLSCPNDEAGLSQDETGDDGDAYGKTSDLLELFSRTAEDILGDAAALEEDEQTYDFLLASSSLLPPAPPTPGAPGLLSPTARRQSLAPAARRRSSAQSNQHPGALSRRVSSYYGNGPASPEQAFSTLTLRQPDIENVPERIGKALEEMQVLISLIRRALDQGLRNFVAARSKQLNGISMAVQEDLKLVLSKLLGPESLILTPIQTLDAAQEGALTKGGEHGQEDGTLQGSETLESWSSVKLSGKQASSDDEEAPVEMSAEVRKLLIPKRRAEQASWLRLVFGSYRALDTLILTSITATATVQSVEGAIPPAALACRQDLEQTLRSGMLSQWVTKSIRSSQYTLLIKSSSEPGYSARDVRIQSQKNAFPAPLEGTAQIQSLSISPSELSAMAKNSAEYEADSQTSEALRMLYNEILRFLSEDVRDLINVGTSDDAAREPGSWTIDAFGTAWDEISRAVLDELGNVIFFVGRPNSFQQNYLLTARFLQFVAQLCPTRATLVKLHEHTGFVAFQKRWQLSVYFRIRLRHILSALETGLSQGLAPVELAHSTASDGVQCAQLQAFQATLEAFSTAWQKDVHLRPLAAREWTLSLQIVSRFKTWLEHEVLNENSTLNQQGSSGDGINGGSHRRTPSASNSWLANSNSNHGPGRESPYSRSRTNSPALGAGTNNKGPGASQQQEEMEHLRLLRWTWIASDVAWLDGQLWQVFEGLVSPAVKSALAVDVDGQNAPEADGVLADMRDALQNALSYRRGFVAVLGRNIVSSLRQSCATAFEALNRSGAITRQYRATASNAANSGPVPSHAFVGQVISPLTEYFCTEQDSNSKPQCRSSPSAEALTRLDVETRTGWAQDVVDDLVDRYANALFTMNKTLESLRRLKRGSTTLGFGSLFGVSSSQQQQLQQQQQEQTLSDGNGPSGAGASSSDPESRRTRKQMEADVAALKAGLEQLCGVGHGLILEGRVPWERLMRAAAGETEGS